MPSATHFVIRPLMYPQSKATNIATQNFLTCGGRICHAILVACLHYELSNRNYIELLRDLFDQNSRVQN